MGGTGRDDALGYAIRNGTTALRLDLGALRAEVEELRERVQLLDRVAGRHAALSQQIERAERALAGCDRLDRVGDMLGEVGELLGRSGSLPINGPTIAKLRWCAERWPWSSLVRPPASASGAARPRGSCSPSAAR